MGDLDAVRTATTLRAGPTQTESKVVCVMCVYSVGQIVFWACTCSPSHTGARSFGHQAEGLTARPPCHSVSSLHSYPAKKASAIAILAMSQSGRPATELRKTLLWTLHCSLSHILSPSPSYAFPCI